MNGIFNLWRINVFAAGNDHIFGTVDDVYVAFLIPSSNVAGRHPAVDDGFCGEFGLLPVAEHISFRLDENFARRGLISGDLFTR